MRVPFSPHPLQHLLLFVVLVVAILTGVRWNLSVVMKHIYSCDFWISSFEKTLFSSFAHFFIRSLILGEFS
jgi:hypothetical protein